MASVLYPKNTRDKCPKNAIIIPIGIPASQSIFCNEIVKYSKEVFGPNNAFLCKIDRRKSFSRQVFRSEALQDTTLMPFIFLDLRTLSNRWFSAIIQAALLTINSSIRGIRVDCYLTDASIVRNRLLAVLITARIGKIVSLLDKNIVQARIPHQRLYGPVFMPISIQTVDALGTTSVNSKVIDAKFRLKSYFVGSLYPERQNMLASLTSIVKYVDFEIIDKSKGLTNQEYWKAMSQSHVSIVTTEQTNVELNWVDLQQERHIVWRISESLAAKSLLIVQKVEGLHQFLIPNEDFFEFEKDEDLETILRNVNANRRLLSKVANSGHLKFRNLQKSEHFWRFIRSESC